jgi:hypothetical protein
MRWTINDRSVRPGLRRGADYTTHARSKCNAYKWKEEVQ